MGIGIVDVGIGNVGSLRGALYSQGWDAHLVRSAGDVSLSSHLILPGVGSFNEGMKRLDQTGLTEEILRHAKSGKPLLGICLGMQMLACFGDEGGKREGLSLIPGSIKKLDVQPKLNLPHVGWNTVELTRDHPVLKGIKRGVDFYFVHSYYFEPIQHESVIGLTEYGKTFSSGIALKNIVGFQFHPEKSQRNGLKILENFCEWQGNA